MRAFRSGRRLKLLKLNSWWREERPRGPVCPLRGEGVRLSGIVQAGSDAVHGGADSIIESGIERRIARACTLTAQQIDLNQAERIDIWVAQAHGSKDYGILFQ